MKNILLLLDLMKGFSVFFIYYKYVYGIRGMNYM